MGRRLVIFLLKKGVIILFTTCLCCAEVGAKQFANVKAVARDPEAASEAANFAPPCVSHW